MNFNIGELDKTYDKCMATGSIKEKNTVDIELIKSLKNVAERGLSFIKRESKNLKKDSDDWTFVFRDYYESLRGLIESFLLFYKIEAENHQCKNAYICFKHPELELNWNFLETIRLKRNIELHVFETQKEIKEVKTGLIDNIINGHIIKGKIQDFAEVS